MTKTELLAQIAATANIIKVLPEELRETVGDIKWYTLSVLEVNSGETLGWKKSIAFYTTDEGTASEKAFFYKEQPQPILPVADVIQAAIKTYIYSQTGIVGFNITNYNQLDKWAEVIVYKINDASTASKANWLVYKSGTSPITHRILA
jgi:hypothetical protein